MQYFILFYMTGNGCLLPRIMGILKKFMDSVKAETECLLNLFEHRRECIILFDKK